MTEKDDAQALEAHVKNWIDQTSKDYASLPDLDLTAHKQAMDAALKIRNAPQREFEKRVANATDRELAQMIYDADEPVREDQRKNHHV